MMHTSRDDYLINTLRFVSTKEATQIYGVVLPESLTSPEMKETKAYKTYLGFATGATPPKKARKFKKPKSPQLSIIPVSPEEPTKNTKRVKRPAKKSTKSPARGVVIRETPEMPLSKKKEKMTLEKCKGIDLLSEVTLTEEAQYEEARQKSLKDFHKTHPSGSGTVTKTAPSAAKIKPSVTNEGIGVKPGLDEVVKEEETEVPVKKTGMRRKQKAKKGINIAKTTQDEFNNERKAFMKDKVKDASSESEIGVDAIPTATKPPTIVNWKIISQSSQKASYQIIRGDGSDKIYMSFRAILKDFTSEHISFGNYGL
ncbi:hypothetical protein Tco_0327267 [Tanacetum coccineum]